MGNHIIAGRLVSIVSLLWIGIGIAAIVRRFGGDAFAARFSGLLFVAYHGYFVGMNEPQLLGQAIMLSRSLLFLHGGGHRSYLFLTALVMLIASLSSIT